MSVGMFFFLAQVAGHTVVLAYRLPLLPSGAYCCPTFLPENCYLIKELSNDNQVFAFKKKSYESLISMFRLYFTIHIIWINHIHYMMARFIGVLKESYSIYHFKT